MITLTSLARSPFDNPRIVESKVLAYTTDHLGRMKAGNPAGGLLDERIAATQSAYDAYKDTLVADMSGTDNRMAAKLGKRQFRTGRLKAQLQRFHAWTMTAVDRVPEADTLVFPKGSYAITQVPDDNLKSALTTLAKKLHSLGDAVPPEIAQEADELLAEWLVVYEKSEQSTAAKQKSVVDKRAARKVLAWELYLNILEIVRLFPNDKRAIERFSVQSLIGFTKPRGER